MDCYIEKAMIGQKKGMAHGKRAWRFKKRAWRSATLKGPRGTLVSTPLPLNNTSGRFLNVSSFSMQTRLFGKEFQSSMHLAGNAFCRKDFENLGLFSFNE